MSKMRKGMRNQLRIIVSSPFATKCRSGETIDMKNIKMSFKTKVLLPMMAIFAASVLIISYINHRFLDSIVETKTNENLEIFADSILTQINHLDIILESVSM